ncbi:MAG: response regulator [Chloroflexi bacterium]|nr:response regulator [Chloroflexota bacterium]
MPKIVVAEDERDILELLRFILELNGFEVVTANNGEEAVQQTLAVMPDLVLMDVRMPRMTGHQACQALKANPKTKGIPVVFLSARGQEADIKQGLSLGAADYILKPFSPEELPGRLRNVLAAAKGK